MDSFIKKKLKEDYPTVKIIKIIGQGVQGEAYLIEKDNLPMVLKIQKKEQEELNRNAYYSYKKLMDVESNYIHKVYDVKQYKTKKFNYLFIFMEFIDGFTMDDFNPIFDHFEKDYTMEQIKLMMAFSMLYGLNTMFAEKIFHRDISYRNIMVRKDVPECVFIDYGLGCDFNNFKKSRCDEGAGNIATKPFHIKSFVDKRYYYVQSIDSALLKCKKGGYDLKNPEVLKMFEDVDLWGVIYTICMLEVYEKGMSIFDIIMNEFQRKYNIVVKKEDLGSCQFSQLFHNSFILNRSIRNFFANENLLFYPLFDAYINEKPLSELLLIVETLLVQNGLEVVEDKEEEEKEEEDEVCSSWKSNPYINPITKRKISSSGPKYRELETKCGKANVDFEKEICNKWLKRKSINPETGRKISKTGNVFKMLKQKCSN